jgi:hypothetical protein
MCIPSSVESITQFCFSCCTALSEFRFEAGGRVSVLGERVFAFCTALESIRIPSSLETIAGSCFNGKLSHPQSIAIIQVDGKEACKLSHSRKIDAGPSPF